MKIRLFIITELILLVSALVNLLKEPGFVICLALAIVVGMLLSKCRWFVLKMIMAILSLIMAVFILGNFYIWAAIVLAVVAVVIFVKVPQKDQNFDIIDTYYDESEGVVFDKQKLNFSAASAEEYYRFDDINIIKSISDDVIDLEHTNFRKLDNVVMIRKFAGNTKIIVPNNMAVSVDYSSMKGQANFFGEKTVSNRERVKYYSHDFSEEIPHLRIYVDVVYGDLTVIKL
ncbi:cell wall-active antibiotics response protein LiaF [Floricoccus penangensis]|uniref:Cell wall-active antibiotics response LiaF-like C-terminal domain-containing protein n=1 Tax=Floricoccus penangensis TaxID=1859475 RepID=A0A9Q5JF62_9LACT|nr:cell wall-active antibiotics response protein LiaF [Floricoccus penangensis]OFI46198.1 hypothetical protein BG262_04070 [Floricoccus penangensis]URZ86918.1 hypothetical protein KIW23_07475 [Floricoccus penangensis]